jgi:hypothetical protein
MNTANGNGAESEVTPAASAAPPLRRPAVGKLADARRAKKKEKRQRHRSRLKKSHAKG